MDFKNQTAAYFGENDLSLDFANSYRLILLWPDKCVSDGTVIEDCGSRIDEYHRKRR